MSKAGSVELKREGAVARVTLARPSVHNAFDPAMVSALRQIFVSLAAEDELRLVVLSGEGPSFCAGADLAWMRDSLDYTPDENVSDARRLSTMLAAIDHCPCPVLVRVHGAALGGGAGLVAVCDIAVASDDAVFGFTEGRLGLAPAVISTYVAAKIGSSYTRALFLTAERFAASKALDIGLVHQLVPEPDLDRAVDKTIASVLATGPFASRACKMLLRRLPGLSSSDAEAVTTAMIARLRASSEGQEGMRAFLEKRRPSWRVGNGGVEDANP
jgi:methylglutaconyl-CoA hydratase